MGSSESKPLGTKNDKAGGYGTLVSSDDSDEEQMTSSTMSTPKISHIHIVAQQHLAQKRKQQQQQQQHQHAGGGIVIASRRRSLDDGDSDQESLVTFGADTMQHSDRDRLHNGRLSRIRSSFMSSRSSIRASIRVAVDRTFTLPGEPCDIRENEGTATMTNEIFNLVKNLVGAGALGLPSGVAAFANAPSALIPATFVILTMGAIFAYYFVLMGRICRITNTASYREAWVDIMGDEGSGLVALFVTLMASLGNLAYSMILADTTKSLLKTAGIEWTRTKCLLLITIVALWPLCNVKKLTVLAPFSLLGMAGILFTVGCMGWRYFDGSYAPGGRYANNLSEDMRPSFGAVGAAGALSADVFILVCMTFQAYFAHYNAPRYYVELKRNTITRFGRVVGSSFGISALLYVLLAVFGFLTFGENSDGFILNNYSTNDGLATMCRVCIAVALVFTYPLPFIGMRDGILDLLEVPMQKQTSQNLNVLTVVILTVITLLAMTLTDLGIVNAVGGALFGTAVVFIFPALMFRDAMHGLGFHATTKQLRESRFSIWLMWLGIAMGVLGVFIAVAG